MPKRPTPPPEVATRDEILVWLSSAASKGHVGAMLLLLEELRRDVDQIPETPSIIDELAGKRTKKAATG